MRGVIGEPSADFMAMRFVVEAGSYDITDGVLEENCKLATEPLDYFDAKQRAREATGYCWKRIVRVSGAERRAEGQTTTVRDVDNSEGKS